MSFLSNKHNDSIPKLYGVFSGGKIEKYLPFKPILRNELILPQLPNYGSKDCSFALY
jgi:hypothetical protein